jgi:SynChlorMet cassette protein ScmD
MPESDKPVANPSVVFRDEFDDWAILFDPDSGNAFGLNPVSAFIWKRLDGYHTTNEILRELRKNCKNVPEEAGNHLKEFLQGLVDQGLAGYEIEKV